MRHSIRAISLIGAAVFASACSPDSERGAPAALDEALRADLQLVDNAHTSGLQVVSAVERPQLAAPERTPAPAPRRAQTPRRSPISVSAPVADPLDDVVVAEVPVATAPAAEVADTPGEAEAPVMAPRPRAPVLVTGPAAGDYPGGRSGGGDIGAVIGVVIRGGTGGGHCPPPRRRPGSVYGGPSGPVGRVGAGVSRDPGAGREREGASATPSVVRAPSGGVAVNNRVPRTGGLGGVVRR